MLVKGATGDSRYGNRYILYIKNDSEHLREWCRSYLRNGSKRYMNWIILTVQLQIKLGGCWLLEGLDILHVNS